LWEAKVPVRNDFLLNEPAKLREHALRLAQLLAEERARPTVIAIDGIDHAARAKATASEQLGGRPSLLEALVPPDEVPDGLVFLIAGQPGSLEYPLWLRCPPPGVEVFGVPPLKPNDIAELLQQEPGTFPVAQVDNAARVIWDLTKGNTLASIYGVWEARSLGDALELQQRLKTRRLDAGLEIYYDTLWTSVLAPFRSRSLTIDTYLAAALATSSVRLTGELLRSLYPDLHLSAAEWEIVLTALQPIIEDRNRQFAIRHNDVRVHLMARLSTDKTALAAATGKMANYYLADEPTEGRHADLFRLLSFAGRTSELPSVFTPEYVVDAWAISRSMDEILDQAQQATTAITLTLGWHGLHEFSLGLATLQQLRAAVQYYDIPEPRRGVPPCLASEARVQPRSSWTLRSLEGLLQDASALLSAGQIPRA